MATYVTPSPRSTGDLITAAIWVQDVVDNVLEGPLEKFTAAGQIFYATGAEAGAALSLSGTAGRILVEGAAAPAWSGNIVLADGTTISSDTTAPLITLGATAVTMPSVDINGGAIDGTAIGASSAAAGTFTNITGDNASIGGQEAANANRVLIVDGNFTATGAATAVVLKVAGTIETSSTTGWGATYGQFHPQGVTLNSTQGAGAFVSAIHARGPAITLNGETIAEAAAIVAETLPTNATHNYAILAKERVGINHGSGEDTMAFELRNSDVNHGLTTGLLPDHKADAYLSLRKLSPTNGAAYITSVSESAQGLNISAWTSGTVNTTKSTAAAAVVEINARHHDGANAYDNMTSNGNTHLWFTVNASGQGRSIMLLDEDGDLYIDAGGVGAVTVFHDQHDMALMHATNVALGRVKPGQYDLTAPTRAFLTHSKRVMQERGVIAWGSNTVAPNGRFDATTVNLRNGLYFAWDLGFYVGQQVERVDNKLQRVMDIITDHCEITDEGKRLLDELDPAVVMLAEVV